MPHDRLICWWFFLRSRRSEEEKPQSYTAAVATEFSFNGWNSLTFKKKVFPNSALSYRCHTVSFMLMLDNIDTYSDTYFENTTYNSQLDWAWNLSRARHWNSFPLLWTKLSVWKTAKKMFHAISLISYCLKSLENFNWSSNMPTFGM